MVSLAGLGLAYPGVINQREVWDGYFDRHYGGVQRGLAKRIIEHSGVTSRHGAINPLIEDVSGWSTQARLRRYLTEALPLGKDAVGSALGAADLVTDLLDRHGLTVGDIDGWAVHPGGPKILDVVRDRLGLPESAIAESRATLATHGNCSSATVLMIIDALHRRPGGPPRRVVALAFGPGLTLYATLMTL
jgi:predicted naringenin-chalcone synthase